MEVKTTIINGGSHRYLSELDDFKNCLPHGIVNKTRCDVGGTFIAVTCDSNYIIVCPFVDLVKSIGADKNVKKVGIEVFECCGKVRESSFDSYMKRNSGKPLKIAVTWDSLPKLLNWMNYKTEGWKLLVDEYHTILEACIFRGKAIGGLLDCFKMFKHYTFLSATPIDPKFEIDFFKELPHYKVTWNNLQKVNVHRIKATKMREGLVRILRRFIDKGFNLRDINGEKADAEQLFIFVNSVSYIKQICDTLELDPRDVKICCSDRQRNKDIIGEYEIENAIPPFRKINFFTSKCFQGCNMFSNSGLIIVASDGGKKCTLVDVSTSMEQIVGRLRENEEYHNRFKNHIIHLYSTVNHTETDDEFTEIMKEKENDADKIISGYSKMDNAEKETFKKHLDLENSIILYENGNPVKSDMKRNCFQFKHELKKYYRDGIYIQQRYEKSEKFCLPIPEKEWKEFDEELADLIIVAYKDLLENYIKTRNEDYELEYPEFKKITKYLTEKEMNSCKWNKERMIRKADDKILMQTAFNNIHEEGKFFTNAEMKECLQNEFNKLGIRSAATAKIIYKECKLYEVTPTKKNGKAGYLLGKRNLDFTI